MNKKLITILMMVLVGVGLYFGLRLMQQRQELRRGAANENIVLDFYSGTQDLASVEVGDKFGVYLLGNASGDNGIFAMVLRFRYNKDVLELGMDRDVLISSAFDGGGKIIEINNEEGFVDVVVTVSNESEPLTGELGTISPLDPFLGFDFTVKSLGNAEVWLDYDYDKSVVAGYSDGSGDGFVFDLPKNGEGENVVFSEILGEEQPGVTNSPTPTVPADEDSCSGNTDCGWCDGVCKSKSLGCSTTPNAPDGWECVCGSDDTCVGKIIAVSTPEPTNTGTPNTNPPICTEHFIPLNEGVAPLTVVLHGSGSGGSGPGFVGYRWDFENDGVWDTDVSIEPVTHTYINPGTYYPKYQILGSNNVWSSVCSYLDVVVRATPTLPLNAKIVSFEVALAGLREQNGCRGSNTVDVIMLKGTNRKEYKNVALVDTGRKTEIGLAIFKVDKLNVTDFGETEDVAIFVKGQKHLQMKYGINGQDAVYNRAGGELDFDNSTVFDFTEYPILAGDVNRDGKVDGIDFTEVKNRAGRFEEVESGQSNVHDLDSSCVVNNIDIGLLTQALREKYDQMY